MRALASAALLPLAATLAPVGATAWSAGPVAAQRPTELDGSSALGVALRRLGTTKRVLMVGAHPDDENTAVLSELALGDGAEVAYLSLTRGEGGQNLIGPELEEPLGLIRSEELLSARRLDGARQFFTRAYDFGYSKSAEETFRQWPRDSLLADVVLVIRRFRPDVVVPVFSGTPRDGHGQHQASGMLAREAFVAAGDPTRFPDQIAAGLRPHRPTALYQALWRGETEGAVALETGALDPLLGRSRHQIAMASRSRHRSQDMGQEQPLGPRRTHLVREDRDDGGASIFAGVDTTLSQHARAAAAPAEAIALLERYEAEVADVRRAFNPFDAYALAPRLAGALELLDRAEAVAGGDDETAGLRFLLQAERADATDALARAAGIVFDATADDARVVPGQTFEVTLTLWNGGAQAVTVHWFAPLLPDGWTAEPLDAAAAELAPSAIAQRRFRVRVPNDAPPTEPYFLREQRAGEIYVWPSDVALRAEPFEPPPVRANGAIAVAGRDIVLDTEATFVEVDKAVGERRRTILVVPALSVRTDPALVVVPLGSGAASRRATEVTAVVRAEAPDGIEGVVRAEVPAGWTAEPASVPIRFGAPGETRAVRFTVAPPAALAAGTYDVGVIAEAAGARFDRGVQIVDYPHTRLRTILHDATVDVAAFDVAIAPGLRIGYIEGAGDDIGRALAQLGATVEPLDAAALAGADLARYDAIVTGIRAYEVRADLAEHNERLLDYVRAGGVAVVQYNKYEFPDGGFAPYPLTMSRPHGRVADEDAPVRLLRPEHTALRWPNRIGARDFQGWAQERGLYFADTWDARYAPLLAMSDPGEAPLEGSLLVAPVGDGLYVYTGLAFFRQVPEAVPGAYRLLANLVSLGKAPAH